MSTFSMVERAARHVLGLTDDYFISQIAMLDDDSGFKVGLGPYPLYRRGAMKGRPNFSADLPKGSFRKGIIYNASVKDATAKYIAETGDCPECDGTGLTLQSCSAERTIWRPCRKCEGTGRFDKIGEKREGYTEIKQKAQRVLEMQP